MNKKKIIITGGAGFIGSHLVDRLIEDGHQITVLDNFSTGRTENLGQQKGKVELIEVDIRNLQEILPFFKGKDTVFHLAALADIVPSVVNPMAYYTSNVLGTANVLEASRLSGVKKFLYSASSSCYGIPPHSDYPTAESYPINTQYPYALTKYLGEQTALHWGKIYNFSVVSLRLFNVYGPRSRTSGTYGAVFGVFLAQKLAGKPFTVVGDGNQTRDFIYVSDVVQAFIKAANSNITNEVFNVGTGSPQSINRLVELLGGEKEYIPKRPGEPDCTWANISKIKSVLDWYPKVSFETGVNNMLKHIDYWKQAPVWTAESIKEATRDWFKCLAEEKR